MRARPVAVAADVGDAGHQRGTAIAREIAIDHARHGGARRPVRVGAQHLLEQRAQIGQVRGETQVLLGDLELHAQLRARHGAEQRMEGLARLEVDGAVLHLQHHIGRELAVARHELAVGLLGAIAGVDFRIHEGAPDHEAMMRRQCGGQHVGAIHVAAAIVLRARLAFRIGLDEKAAEVRDQAVDLVGLGPPPGGHGGVQRVGRLEPEFLGRREARGQEHADAIRPHHIGQRRHLLQPRRGQHLGLGVDVVEHGGVDAERGVGPRVVDITLSLDVRELAPIPDREARIAAFDRAVRVVPMVEHAPLDLRRAALVQMRQIGPRLRRAQPGKAAVEQATLAVGRDQRDRVALKAERTHEIAFLPQLGQGQRKLIQSGQASRRGQHERTIAKISRERRLAPAHLRDAAPELARRRLQHGRPGPRHHERSAERAHLRLSCGGQGAIAQPQLVAVLDLGRRRVRHHRQQQRGECLEKACHVFSHQVLQRREW